MPQTRSTLPVQKQAQKSASTVFDWAWADAYKRNGLPYYPKLLCAVPFTPVQGNRLLSADAHALRHLAATLMAFAEQADVSSLHVLFPTEAEAGALADMGMMQREGVQFHWLNDGYRDFDDFLSTLEQKKRKNIRAERRKVHEAGVTMRRIRGEDIQDADWRFFSKCYRQTYREHFSTPYLNLDFFRMIGASMPENLLLVIAEYEGKPIASSLVVYQRDAKTGGTLYGRYWGALEHVPCLHFETAYYQPLEFCIEEKLGAFEGGAQGEHKMARGFLPTVTRSAHWLGIPLSPMPSATSSTMKRTASTRMWTSCANTIRSKAEARPWRGFLFARMLGRQRLHRHRNRRASALRQTRERRGRALHPFAQAGARAGIVRTGGPVQCLACRVLGEASCALRKARARSGRTHARVGGAGRASRFNQCRRGDRGKRRCLTARLLSPAPRACVR